MMNYENHLDKKEMRTVMTVQDKTVVAIEFSIKEHNGQVLEATEKGAYFVFLQGSGELLPGIEASLEGKTIGDEVTLHLAPEKAFGFVDEGLKKVISISNWEEEIQVGDTISLYEDDETEWRVHAIEGSQAYIDGNHPWAGKALAIWIRIVGIRFPTSMEIRTNTVDPNSAVQCGSDCNC